MLLMTHLMTRMTFRHSALQTETPIKLQALLQLLNFIYQPTAGTCQGVLVKVSLKVTLQLPVCHPITHYLMT